MKKIMAGMLSACIAFSSLTIPALAKNTDVMLASAKGETEDKSMEKALLMVKEKISVPKELTEFNYRLNYLGGNNSKNKCWNFDWRDKDNNESIAVGCDEDGNILSYSTYKRDRESSKPTYLKEELVKNATDFIKKVAPNIVDNIVLDKSEFSGVYSGSYLYTFSRVENGIRMPDNNVSVSVNYETGEVTDFNLIWAFDVEIPTAETNVTIKEAREKIGEKVSMSLKYMNKTEKVNEKNVVKAYLVYVPDKSYMAVDAKTGDIYDTRDEFYSMDELTNVKNEMFSGADMNASEGELTTEEINEINEMKNLITKEDAIFSVTSKKDILLLDDMAKAIDARLVRNYSYGEDEKTEYVWRLSFRDPRDVDYSSHDTYRARTDVSVDAKTGKILSFYSSVRDYYDAKTKEWENVKVKYNVEECRDTFEKFVKSIEKEKFSNTRLSDSSDTAYVLKYINEEPVYGGYSYNYSRYNEGVEYSYDRIFGKVDGVTGKIYSYNVDWTNNIEFESPDGAISPTEAYKAYSEKEGFELVYEINNKHYIEENPSQNKYYDYSNLYVLEKEARLVYRTDINPNCISPFTGEQLDFSGNVYEDVNEKEYTDVLGYWAERDIKLITDMGYTFNGEEFLPEKTITKDELIKLLRVVRCYVNEEDYKGLEKITKLDTVKMIIKELGLERVAKISDIYNVSFSDINKVPKEDIGYIALAKGLGLISGDTDNNFNPDRELKRIEAVCMALKLANVK